MVKIGSEGIENEDGVEGNARPLSGRYHVGIKDVSYLCLVEDEEGKKKNVEVEEDDDTADKIRMKFEVLHGTVPGQVGREIDDNFYLTEKAIPRLQRLALCIGLLKPGEPQKEVLFSKAVGQQLVIEIKDDSYKDRNGKEQKTVRVDFLGFWSLGNQAVADVPKNADMIKVMPKIDDDSPSKPPAAEKAQTAAAEDDKWNNL